MTCPALVAPDNGQVVVTGVSVGSTATYSCLPGFVLQGVTQRSCRDSGDWDGQDPVCVGESDIARLDAARKAFLLGGGTF